MSTIGSLVAVGLLAKILLMIIGLVSAENSLINGIVYLGGLGSLGIILLSVCVSKHVIASIFWFIVLLMFSTAMSSVPGVPDAELVKQSGSVIIHIGGGFLYYGGGLFSVLGVAGLIFRIVCAIRG